MARDIWRRCEDDEVVVKMVQDFMRGRRRNGAVRVEGQDCWALQVNGLERLDLDMIAPLIEEDPCVLLADRVEDAGPHVLASTRKDVREGG